MTSTQEDLKMMCSVPCSTTPISIDRHSIKSILKYTDDTSIVEQITFNDDSENEEDFKSD